MTFRSIRARWLAVAGGVIAVLAVTTAVLAQPQPQFRFYGLPGGATIDGDPAPAGATVTAAANGVQLGSAVIGEAGTWFVDVEPNSTGIVFSLNGHSSSETYDAETVGGSQKIELHVTSTADDSLETGDDSMMEADEDALEMEDASGSDSMMEDDGDQMGGLADDTEDYPTSGSGGLLDEGSATWPFALGLTAGLMALVAGAALIISRRTDSVR